MGLEELQARLKENVKLEDVKNVVKYRGAQLQDVAQTICPRDSGELARHITLEITDGGYTAVVEAHKDYAGYVEYGTRYMEAQPYMKPAYMQESARFKEDLSKLVR